MDILFFKNDKVSWKLVEDCALLIDGEEGELVELNPVGAEIWRHLDGKTLDEIIMYICNEFDVNPKRAKKDVIKFINRLKDMELIEERK